MLRSSRERVSSYALRVSMAIYSLAITYNPSTNMISANYSAGHIILSFNGVCNKNNVTCIGPDSRFRSASYQEYIWGIVAIGRYVSHAEPVFLQLIKYLLTSQITSNTGLTSTYLQISTKYTYNLLLTIYIQDTFWEIN